MPRKLRIVLRLGGVGLVVLAAALCVIAVAGTMQTEEHATASGGYVIQHRIEISHETSAMGLAGALLFGLSFIPTQKAR